MSCIFCEQFAGRHEEIKIYCFVLRVGQFMQEYQQVKNDYNEYTVTCVT
jgi:hypothetical protein